MTHCQVFRILVINRSGFTRSQLEPTMEKNMDLGKTAKHNSNETTINSDTVIELMKTELNNYQMNTRTWDEDSRSFNVSTSDTTNVEYSHGEAKQFLDDVVTKYFLGFGIEDDEDVICDLIGLDDFHKIRDFQNSPEDFVDIEIADCSDDEYGVMIITKGRGEKHEWLMQSAEGRFDSSLGCLEFLNGTEFDPDDLTEIEKLHYEAANDCFNVEAPRFYEERQEEAFFNADKYFYAEDLHGDNSSPCDLSRFTDENERNEYVDSVNNADNGYTARKLSTEYALQQHKGQFEYWNNSK